MDIQTAVIGGLTFVVCAGILMFISKFGMKEKSYEEALAEQRKRTGFLVPQKPVRPKEKKVKKSTKKVKEKHSAATIESETAEESEDTDSPALSASHIQQKLHVEFKEPTIIEELPKEESVPIVSNKQKLRKKAKVRPILIHKPVENPVITNIVEVPSANHFEQLHPKDEFELMHSHLKPVKENQSKSDAVKEKSQIPKYDDEEIGIKERNTGHSTNPLNGKENKNKQPGSSKEKINKEKQSVVVEEIPKPKKQQKLEAAQSTASNEETIPDAPSIPVQTNGFVSNVSKEKKKKKNESVGLHHLTGSKDVDVNLTLLLNAVRKAELSRSEVQILIDLLLNKQHEAPETLDEWSEGKADPVQKLKRQLAEKEKALTEEQEALAGVQAKLREIRSEQTTERVQLQQRNRSMEEALAAKHLEVQALNSRALAQNQKIQQLQAQLNDEAILLRNIREENTGLQLQRQQVDIHLSQAQEAEATIQDLQSRNNQLSIELHALTEQNMATKDHQQNVIVQLQHQVNLFKGELDEKESINRQLDDMRRDLEHRLSMTHRIENELKHEISQINSVCQQHAEEIRRLEHGKAQALEEARNLQKQKEDLDHAVSLLKLELRDLQGDNAELRQLRSNAIDEESENHKAQLLQVQNELLATKSEVINMEKEMSDLKKNHLTAISEYKESIAGLQTDLDEQKNKNNELSSKIRTEEQQTNIKFIQRLFPNIDVPNNLPYNEWSQNAEKYIENYLQTLENSIVEEDNSGIDKLQAQLQHYKSIITDTEGVLKNLQSHIEQEEILWRNEMRNKDLEIESIKKQYSSEITTKVQHLERQLSVERESKQKLSEQYEQMKTSQSSAISANSAIIEKLSEEVKQLNQQLTIEKSKIADQPIAEVNNSSSIKLENNSSNGPLLEQEAAK